jgi:hypothetical protein
VKNRRVYATRVIENGAFPFWGCTQGQDFGTRIDLHRPEFDPYLTRLNLLHKILNWNPKFWETEN